MGELSAQEEQQHEKARRLIDQVLSLVETDSEGKFDMEQFRQAMLLGTDRDPVAFASRLRGADPEAFRKVEIRRLVKYLRWKREVRNGCLSLPFTLVWFSAFFAVVLSHTRQETVYRLTEAVARNAAPMVEMQTGYPGSLLTWVNSHIAEPYAARYNQIIGGVHVSKASANKDDYNLTTLESYNKFDFIGDVMRTGGGWVRKRQDHSKPKFAGNGSYGRDDSAWILWPLDDQAVATDISKVHSWWQWLSADSPVTLQNMSKAVPLQQPERTEVRMLSYNKKLKFYVLYRVTFMARSSGAIEVTEKASAFDAEPVWLDFKKDMKSNTRRAIMAADAIFALMLCWLFFMKIGDLYMAMKYNQINNRYFSGGSTCFHDYMTRWVFLDWCCIFMGVCYIWMYFFQNYLTKQFLALVDDVPSMNATGLTRPVLDQRLVEADSPLTYSWMDRYSNYILQLDACQEQALQLEQAVQDSRWFIIIFAMCCGLRFFKAFRGNPRMNFVLQTMSKASVDFGHFLIIFVMVFVSFVVIGHMTFGGTIDDFSTFGKAVHATFLIMMGFVFDEYKVKMLDSTASLGVAWTAVFNLVMGLLFLNMIFAIIFDVYKDVRSGAVDSPSALQQLWEFWIAKPSRPEEMPELLQASQDVSLPDGRLEPPLWPTQRTSSSSVAVSSVAVEPGQSLQVRSDQFGPRDQAWGAGNFGMPAARVSETSTQAYPTLSLDSGQPSHALVVQAPDGTLVQRPASQASELPWGDKGSCLTMPGASVLLQPNFRSAPNSSLGPLSSMQANLGGSQRPSEESMAPHGSMGSTLAGPALSMQALQSFQMSPSAAGAQVIPVGTSSMQALQSYNLTPSAAGARPMPVPAAGPLSSTVPEAGDFKPPQPSSSSSQLPPLAEVTGEGRGREEPVEAQDGKKKSCCKRCCSKCCRCCKNLCRCWKWCCRFLCCKRKDKKVCEGRILRILYDDDAREEKLVGVEDLAEKLTITEKKDIWQLQCIINSAAKQASIDEEEVSLMDEVRLCGRIDANVREIGAMVTDIALRAQDHAMHCQMMVKQRLIERQAAEQAEIVRAAQEARQKADAEEKLTQRRELVEAKILPDSDDNRARGVDQHFRDSPEPEPPIGSLDSILEERLKRAAQAQAERHLHLEKAIARLTDRLEPMLKASAEDQEALPGRLERLESKVRKLAGKLDPILANFQQSFQDMDDDPLQPPLATKNAFSTAW